MNLNWVQSGKATRIRRLTPPTIPRSEWRVQTCRLDATTRREIHQKRLTISILDHDGFAELFILLFSDIWGMNFAMAVGLSTTSRHILRSI